VLRLLVKDVLIGPEKITIRHRIPIREPASSGGAHHDTTDTEGDMRQGYELCWGRVRGHNASAVLAAICPITRGWASFYRPAVSKQLEPRPLRHKRRKETAGPSRQAKRPCPGIAA